MKPVNLDKRYTPKRGINDFDSFLACVASILECSIIDVVNPFINRTHWEKFHYWAKQRGFAIGGYHRLDPRYDLYCIATAKSPRRDYVPHSVVYRNGKMIHDPHPEKTGIRGLPMNYLYFLPLEKKEVTYFKVLKELESLKVKSCDICEVLSYECGCTTEGRNEGIDLAIKKIENL